MRILARPEMQAAIVLLAGVAVVFLAPPQRVAVLTSDVLLLYAVAGPLTLIFRPQFLRGAGIAVACFIATAVALSQLCERQVKVPEDTFTLPAATFLVLLPISGLLYATWRQADRARPFARAELQFAVSMTVAAIGVAIAPREAGILVALAVVTLFTVTAAAGLIFRETFFANAFVALLLWTVMLILLPQFANLQKPMREDAMVFLFPMMIVLPAFAIAAVAHYVVRARRRKKGDVQRETAIEPA